MSTIFLMSPLKSSWKSPSEVKKIRLNFDDFETMENDGERE